MITTNKKQNKQTNTSFVYTTADSHLRFDAADPVFGLFVSATLTLALDVVREATALCAFVRSNVTVTVSAVWQH